MRVVACGSAPRKDRPGWTDRDLLFRTLDVVASSATVLVEGEAPGADLMAREWAEARGIAVEPHPAHWRTHGRAAGMIRNREMIVPVPDAVVAFTTSFPPTTGTANMVGLAVDARVPTVWIVTPDGRLRTPLDLAAVAS